MVGVMNESKLIFLKSEYSYLQYHWWPKDFRVRFLEIISSDRYRILIDGIAIVTKRKIGRIVQIVSIKWSWRRNRLVRTFVVRINII